MSMRGQIISKEYQRMVFVQDRDGKEFSCYLDDVKNFDPKKGLTGEQREKCLDISQVAGDNW